jgi:hypothetical protein
VRASACRPKAITPARPTFCCCSNAIGSRARANCFSRSATWRRASAPPNPAISRS